MKHERSEFEGKEKAAQEELKTYSVRFNTLDAQIKSIDKCLSFSLAPDTLPNQVLEYLSWLDKVEALGFEEVNRPIKENRYRARFSTPSLVEQNTYQDVNTFMSTVKSNLEWKKKALVAEREVLANKFIPEAEEKAHRRRVDRLTLEYGKDSVDYTKKNIVISLWVPVLTFLLGTVLFEIFKPEIVNGIRQILGLAKIP